MILAKIVQAVADADLFQDTPHGRDHTGILDGQRAALSFEIAAFALDEDVGYGTHDFTAFSALVENTAT